MYNYCVHQGGETRDVPPGLSPREMSEPAEPVRTETPPKSNTYHPSMVTGQDAGGKNISASYGMKEWIICPFVLFSTHFMFIRF